MPSMSISGVVSGMDWESMIDEIITAAAKPAQVQVSKKTNLQNKKSLFEEMKVMVQAIQTSMTSLKLPSTYKAKAVDIERVDTSGSYKGVLTATVNADAEVNVYDIVVQQLASAQTNRSKQITASTIASTLASGGVTDSSSKMYITAAGQRVGIDVYSTDSLQSLKSRINNTIKTLDTPLDITASIVDNQLVLKSDNTGLGQSTAEETITYLGGNSTLENIAVEEGGTVSITGGGNSYTQGTDFVVVNGTDIRWNLYDRSNEVALGTSVNAKYTMTAGDVYTSSGQMADEDGDGEVVASVSGFTMIDQGTLGSRVKIVDDNGNEYVYGRDFTLDSNGKVVWEDTTVATTNEPSSYTVNYTKTETVSASAPSSRTVSPTSYTLSYSGGTVSWESSEITSNLDYSGRQTITGLSSVSTSFPTVSVTTSSSSNVYSVMDAYNREGMEVTLTVTDGSTTDTFEYGTNFIFNSVANSDAPSRILWNKTRDVYTSYVDAKGGFETSADVPANDTKYKLSLTYTPTYTTDTDKDSDSIADVMSAAYAQDGNYSGITINADGQTYTYGTDFTLVSDDTGGYTVQWLHKDELEDSDYTALQEAYREVYGLEDDENIPTITLTDSNGVIRTYLDPEDPQLFTLTDEDGNSYEYGRDYVVRVNDTGDGYVFSWALTGSDSITRANTEVTTYTQAKNISTYGMKAAPSSGKGYTFTFSQDITTEESAKVKSSASDKSLETLFDGITIDSSDYSLITIDDGNETTYTYGVDFKIADGELVWLDKGSYAATYTFSSTASASASGTMGTSGYANVSLAALDDLGLNTTGYVNSANGLTYNYVDESYGKAAFTLTDSDGNTYEYGKDFCVRCISTTSSTLQVVSPTNAGWPSDFTGGGALASGTTFTLNYSNTYTAYSADTDSTDISDVLGFNPQDLSSLTITGGLGATYTYSSSAAEDLGDTEFTIDDDGAVTFKPEDSSLTVKNPAEGAAYTLTYEAFTAPTYTAHYDGEDTIEAVFTVDSGKGDINDTQLSWEQILSDTGLKASSSDERFAQFFTLTDEDGDAYEYGTDYRIIQGDEVTIPAEDEGEDDTVLHKVLIEWIEGGKYPFTGSVGMDYTLTYTGRGTDGGEVIQMDNAVTRSATDAISADTSNMKRLLYSDTEDASVRITGGGEDFQQGIDFTIEEDSFGYASVVWNTDTQGTPSYSQYFDGATSITVLDADGNEVDPDTYTITPNTSGQASFNMEDDYTLDEGDYTIKVVKNGITKVYDLASDGASQTITRRSLWESQDNTDAGTYTIYVSKNGNTETYEGTRPAGSYDFYTNPSATPPSASDFDGGTTTITQGTKTFYEGVDFTIDEDDDGYAAVNWITDSDGGYEWYYPNPGSVYTINHTDSDGSTTTYTASRSGSSTLSMLDYGMTTANGALSVQYGDDTLYYNLDVTDEDGNTGNDVLKATHSFTIARGQKLTEDGDADVFTFNWQIPTQTAKSNIPSYGTELTVEYTYDSNTFSLSDDGDGLIDALGLNSNVTEAHNAILLLDGEEVQRDSNNIGADYGNELLKGVTMQLKGLGEVSMDIYHDAEKAVEAITTFKDGYNDLMTWMNTRMTESQLDENTAATVDSDDFRMRWGLLHGNSLLRNTKSQMRNIMAQNFTYYFSTRTSASEIYGTMANNGLTNSATLRMRIGSTYCDLSILPTHSLQDIVDMINDSTNPAMRNNFYDENGNLREQQLIKASISEDKLVISSTGDDTITLSGTQAMNALKLNYTYKGLFQVGLATTSTDYGKSGELEFDESKFMEALEDNPDEVQEMMLMFASNMDTWLKSMLTSSASGETSGTLTRQIEDIDTQIKSIDEYLEKYQERLDRQEEALRTKFAAAEQSISRLSQQASSIAAILNQLNGYNSGSSTSSSSS